MCRLTVDVLGFRHELSTGVVDCTGKPRVPHVAGLPQGVGEYEVCA